MSTQVPKPDMNEREVNRVLREEEAKRKEPMLYRHSDIWGKVEIYAPFAPVSSWKDLPWTLKLERYNGDGSRRFKIRPDKIMDAFQSPGLLESHKYLYVEPDLDDEKSL